MSVTTEPPKRDLSRYWLEYFVANTTSLLEIPFSIDKKRSTDRSRQRSVSIKPSCQKIRP